MRRAWILAISLLAVLVLLIGMGAVACDGNGQGTTPPQSGEWAVSSTGSSQFSLSGFIVNPDSTGIAVIYYQFNSFECMGDYLSGDVETSWEPVRPITGGQFTIDLVVAPQYGPDWDIVIEGGFDETGTHASGTWEISAAGIPCKSGTWEGVAGLPGTQEPEGPEVTDEPEEPSYHTAIYPIESILSGLAGAMDVDIDTIFQFEWLWGATHYEFELATDSSFATVLESTPADFPFYLPADSLDCDTTYYLRARAMDYSTPFSDWVSAGFHTEVAPAGTQDVPINIIFLWEEVLGATHYEFELATDSSFTTILESAATLGPDFSFYVPASSLDYDTTYYWRVRAMADTTPLNDWVSDSFHTEVAP